MTQPSGAGDSSARMQINVRLQPVEGSERPIFSNFVATQGAAAMVVVDFGFLEPSAVPAVARAAQASGKPAEPVNGQLTCRVAMGLDTAAQLAQQLSQILQSAMTQAQHAREAAGNA